LEKGVCTKCSISAQCETCDNITSCKTCKPNYELLESNKCCLASNKCKTCAFGTPDKCT
jgi:hypothetical protein